MARHWCAYIVVFSSFAGSVGREGLVLAILEIEAAPHPVVAAAPVVATLLPSHYTLQMCYSKGISRLQV